MADCLLDPSNLLVPNLADCNLASGCSSSSRRARSRRAATSRQAAVIHLGGKKHIVWLQHLLGLHLVGQLMGERLPQRWSRPSRVSCLFLLPSRGACRTSHQACPSRPGARPSRRAATSRRAAALHLVGIKHLVWHDCQVVKYVQVDGSTSSTSLNTYKSGFVLVFASSASRPTDRKLAACNLMSNSPSLSVPNLQLGGVLPVQLAGAQLRAAAGRSLCPVLRGAAAYGKASARSRRPCRRCRSWPWPGIVACFAS